MEIIDLLWWRDDNIGKSIFTPKIIQQVLFTLQKASQKNSYK